MDRITTGLSRLDKMLEGGFPSETVVLLSGGAGTGKTLVGMNFLIDGAFKGEECCYVSLNEGKEELLRACSRINSLKTVDRYIDKKLAIERVIMGKRITVEYFTKIFASYPEVDRLVIDNINKLLIFAENKNEYRIHLAELIIYLKEKVKCTLLVCETMEDKIDTGNGETFECDGVVHLSFSDFEEKPMRTLEVSKMRYTFFEPKIPHELIIDSKELKLSGTKIL